MLSVAERFKFNQIRVVPTYISPLRIQTQGSDPEHRVAMLRLGIEGHENLMQVDTREIKRGGISYSVDTLRSYVNESADQDVTLIVGMDQFAKFDQWKEFDEILKMADVVVTSRPGLELPTGIEAWPMAMRPFVADIDSKQAILTTGKTIYFYQLDDVEASGTEIRRKVRLGQSLQSHVSRLIEEYIERNKLYRSVQTHIGDFSEFSKMCAEVLNQKGGINTQVYDIHTDSSLTDFAVISSGTSTRHTSALAEHLMQEVKKQYGVWPEHMEGHAEGRWVVIDYGAMIAHIFYDYVRQEYRLEELWSKRR
jgi:nicotinate-nucleotide adenylyltransferase